MHIAVLGTGYVGLVSGTCFAELGNHVACIDVDAGKIDRLKAGEVPIYEPGLQELVQENTGAGRLRFTTDIVDGIKDAKIIFLAVGTPSASDGSADLSYLFQAARDIAKALTQSVVVVTKSTVPVGTADQLRDIFKAEAGHVVHVASNPEFLREGAAIKDFLNAERVVVGVDEPELQPLFEELYRGVVRTDRPLVFTSVRSAELTKYACNAFLATKISFVNEMATLAEEVGANIKDITRGMGLDSRIGTRFLQAGIGYGGSCFPKDVRALRFTMAQAGMQPQLLDAVDGINERQKELLLKRVTAALGSLDDKTIAVWGLTFKPRTDDVRESAALSLVPKLVEAGARVQAFDPKGMDEARHHLPPETIFASSSLGAVKGADALLVLTEWDEFRNIELEEVAQAMRGTLLLDGRNIYTSAMTKKAGLDWHGVGISQS
jgi:UDPglucose 6-dehydrogenase